MVNDNNVNNITDKIDNINENMDINKKCGYSNNNMKCFIDLSSNKLYINCENK